jgi:hypothetical protein
MTTTMRATALGMTIDFAAPELKTSNQATKHTDMFAYGKTVQCLQGHCEPGAQEAFHDRARGQTAALVKDLTLDEPKSRPAAKHVIERSPFFAILNDVRIRDSRVCLLCEMNGDECNKDADAGIECSEGHFHCGSCVAKSVQDLLKVENKGKHARQKGEVKCFKCPEECNAPGFTDRDLARHLSVDVFQAYLKARQEAACQEASRKCSICLEDKTVGLDCEETSGHHFICAECAPQEVQRILQEIQEEPAQLARHREQGGHIKCVQPNCEAAYPEPALARVLSNELYRQFRAAQDQVVEQRLFDQLQARFQEQLAAARAEFEMNNAFARTQQDAAATAEFMRRQYPNAVQCPRCGAGPVIPENCYNLQTHHGENARGGGQISNACPACRFFSRERGDWVTWNGQMR